MEYVGWLEPSPEEGLVKCESCYTLDWRTMIAHLMMVNYQEGIASQAVIECIEDTHAMIPETSPEFKISLLCYPRGGVASIPEVAKRIGISEVLICCWRFQWLRRLASSLEAHGLLTLDRPILQTETERAGDARTYEDVRRLVPERG